MKTRTITKRTIAIVGVIAILTMAIGAFGVIGVKAANPDTQTVTFTTSAAMTLNLSASTFAFGTIDPATYPVGSQLSPSGTEEAATVKSNKNWTLNIKTSVADANPGFFTDDNGTGTNTVPVGRMSWKNTTDSGSFAAITATNAAAATGTKTASSIKNIDYEIYSDWTDEPASNYSATVVYTVTQP